MDHLPVHAPLHLLHALLLGQTGEHPVRQVHHGLAEQGPQLRLGNAQLRVAVVDELQVVPLAHQSHAVPEGAVNIKDQCFR